MFVETMAKIKLKQCSHSKRKNDAVDGSEILQHLGCINPGK